MRDPRPTIPQFRRGLAAALALALFLPTFPLQAGLPAPPEKEPEEAGVVYSDVDPGLDDSASRVGEELGFDDADPLLIDEPAQYAPEDLGREPSDFGYPEEFDRAAQAAAWTPLACADNPAPVPDAQRIRPVALGGSAANPNDPSRRYLSYTGTPRILVGESADAACHFKVNAAANAAMCVWDNYRPFLCGLSDGGCNANNDPKPAPVPAPKLNKIRLWVAIAGETNPDNVPFARESARDGLNKPYQYWRLDQPNADYFNRLRSVVSLAKDLGIFVEVTFFAPWIGKDNFPQGAWYFNPPASPTALNHHPNSKAVVGGALTQVGFTEPPGLAPKEASRYFVTEAPGGAGAPNNQMRIYQKKIIEWTVKALWCFDNVFWEIANEPEGREVDPTKVADWQKSMIQEVIAKEAPKQPNPLARPHLIAVQPFTTAGFDAMRGYVDPSGKRYVSVFNGHYTQVKSEVNNANPQELNLGALQLARNAADLPLALGFNEGKITPLGGSGGTVKHENSAVALVDRAPEPARAEAWEFALEQGGIHDHWGYKPNPIRADGTPEPTYAVQVQTYNAARAQMQKLKAFFDGLPLARLYTSKGVWITGAFVPNSTQSGGGSWSGPETGKPSGMPKYPEGRKDWERDTSSQRYWASLQTAPSDASRMFLLYTHHSTRRCKSGSFSATACPDSTPTTDGTFLGFGGYDARVWTVNPPTGARYQDKLKINLGPAAGKFKLEWLNPANLASTQGVPFQTLVWNPAGTGTCAGIADCILCNNAASCQITSPNYSYDNLLKLTQQ